MFQEGQMCLYIERDMNNTVLYLCVVQNWYLSVKKAALYNAFLSQD